MVTYALYRSTNKGTAKTKPHPVVHAIFCFNSISQNQQRALNRRGGMGLCQRQNYNDGEICLHMFTFTIADLSW